MEVTVDSTTWHDKHDKARPRQDHDGLYLKVKLPNFCLVSITCFLGTHQNSPMLSYQSVYFSGTVTSVFFHSASNSAIRSDLTHILIPLFKKVASRAHSLRRAASEETRASIRGCKTSKTFRTGRLCVIKAGGSFKNAEYNGKEDLLFPTCCCSSSPSSSSSRRRLLVVVGG